MKKFIILLCLLNLSFLTGFHFKNCLSERIANLKAGMIVMNLSLKHYHESQKRMIKEIELEVHETAKYTGISHLSPKVLQALEQVPRHLFVLPEDESKAYINEPRSIGEGQTISQPFIVAIMTELLDIQPHDKVLEIGTGSGYQAAILSHLAEKVYSVETISSLAQATQKKLTQLGYKNVHVSKRDGTQGWYGHAPYNKIIVAAASQTIPPLLLKQLAKDGILVIPLGTDNNQFLTIVHKNTKGEITQRTLLPVKFVPFT